MRFGFSLPGLFGKAKPPAASGGPWRLEDTDGGAAARRARKRRRLLGAGICTPAAVLLLFVAPAQWRGHLLAEAEAMCPLLQTNYGGGLSPTREFWVDEERSRKATVPERLVDLGARLR